MSLINNSRSPNIYWRQKVHINGFTLIELMITIAIMGAVTSIAIPTYGNYIAGTQLTEAFVLANTVVADVTANINEDNSYTPDSVLISGTYVKSINVLVDGGSEIGYAILFKTNAEQPSISPLLAGQTLFFYVDPSGAAQVKCQIPKSLLDFFKNARLTDPNRNNWVFVSIGYQCLATYR